MTSYETGYTVLLTYDDSAATRTKLATYADLILYKPVCMELTEIVNGLRLRIDSATDKS